MDILGRCFSLPSTFVDLAYRLKPGWHFIFFPGLESRDGSEAWETESRYSDAAETPMQLLQALFCRHRGRFRCEWAETGGVEARGNSRLDWRLLPQVGGVGQQSNISELGENFDQQDVSSRN